MVLRVLSVSEYLQSYFDSKSVKNGGIDLINLNMFTQYIAQQKVKKTEYSILNGLKWVLQLRLRKL